MNKLLGPLIRVFAGVMLIAPGLVVTGQAHSKNRLIQSSSTNVQLLRGYNYEVGQAKRVLATLEHANQWSHGDMYAFLDYSVDGRTGNYAELSPRFSLSKLGLLPQPERILKDYYLATAVELGEGGLRRYLYGVGIDIATPWFRYLKLNVYRRDNPEIPGTTIQTTVNWSLPFKVGALNMVLEGFADMAGSEGGVAANQLVVPRLLVDTSRYLGWEQGTAYVGIEYQYWRNKFGISGVTESVPQMQFKVNL